MKKKATPDYSEYLAVMKAAGAPRPLSRREWLVATQD